ncbi:RNA polymerase small subunit, putative [Plasmodium ovale curtisi]|uniref:RNA polymerase small subunit, putative n=1 Tax=Plasmodium ovale curtisi TaxID=864141 RepID=A0A1A8WXI8_PLAOA|nr:RNA polymerase small subunit, putative [Plasmodium ovale curtisi]SBS97679.1 RNA polymerase small subunit, putative [Plasmodium ovale curtisi]
MLIHDIERFMYINAKLCLPKNLHSGTHNPDKEGVEFAGYTVPHPTQAEINLRIQTTVSASTATYASYNTLAGEPAVNILMDSLSDLFQVCNIMMTKFQFALDSAS